MFVLLYDFHIYVLLFENKLLKKRGMMQKHKSNQSNQIKSTNKQVNKQANKQKEKGLVQLEMIEKINQNFWFVWKNPD